MLSIDFIKKISKVVSSKNLGEINKIMIKEKKIFEAFLETNQILMDDWLDHIYEAYADGGLVAAS